MTSKQGPAFGLWRACRGRTAGRPFPKRQTEHVGSLDGEFVQQVAEKRRVLAHRQTSQTAQHSSVSRRADANTIESVEMPIQRCPRGQRHPHPVQQQDRRARAAAAHAKMSSLNPGRPLRLRCHVEPGTGKYSYASETARPSTIWPGSTFTPILYTEYEFGDSPTLLPASIVVSILAERSLRRGTSRQPAGPDVQAASVVLAYVRLIQPPVPPRRVMPLSR